MKALIAGLSVLMVGILLFTGCGGIPPEVQDELNQLRADKRQWEEVDKPALKQQIRDLNDRLAKVPHDPTYDELMEFMARDNTDECDFTGHDRYAAVFLNNARSEAGIQGYAVAIYIRAKQAWFFAGFYCTDRKDWVFILPAIDQEAKLVKGEKFHEINSFSSSFEGDDTIEYIRIFLN